VIVTVGDFISEVGDIGRFDNHEQLQKLSGYAIMANDSSEHTEENQISYHERQRLRYLLYKVMLFLVESNSEFHEIQKYYRM